MNSKIDLLKERVATYLRGLADFDGPYVLIFSGPGDEWAGLDMLAGEVRAAL